MDLARRRFLHGRTTTVQSAQRPPWALTESAFTDICTRCGDCLRACPTGLLQAGPGNYPVADFRQGHCTFCGDCSRACTPHAIAADLAQSPWDLRIVINDSCLTLQNVVCRTCGELCEAAAIRFTPRIGGVAVPQVDLDRCTGCGECLTPCPTQAISLAHRPSPTHTPNPQEIAA